MPMQNYTGLSIMAIAAYLNGSNKLVYSALIMIITTAITLMLAPLYHSFYMKTHKKNNSLSS